MSTLTLSSRTSAVTVFRRGAMVTRLATLQSDADGFPRTVRVEGLPLMLDDSSVQVSVRRPDDEEDASRPLPWAGDVRVTLAVPEPDPQLRPPTNEELDRARLEVEQAQRHEADLEGIAEQLQRLVPRSRGLSAEGEPPLASPTEARLALLEFRRQQLDALNTRRGEATETTRQAKERLATLKERERRATKARNPRQFEARKAVVVGLRTPEGAAPTRVVLELSYRVRGARWAPSYVLRLDRSLGGGVLELQALVGQATGERWSDVDLSLSTALPQQWTELPELRSMRIGRRQPPPPKTGWRPSPTGTDELFADYDRDLAPAKRAKPKPKPTPRQAPPPPQAPPAGFPVPGSASTGTFDLADLEGEPDAMDFMVGGAEPVAAAAGPPVPSAPAPAAPAPAMPSAPPMGGAPPGMARMRASAQVSFGGGGPSALVRDTLDEEPEPASVASTLVANHSQLEYGRLRVPAADAPHRGTLRRMTQEQLYAHWGSLASADVAMALSRLGSVEEAALRLERRRAPGSHRWAEGHDGFDHAYEAKARVDLDSDGVFVGIPLQRPPVETSPKYVAVPRETQDVFRVVAVRNPIDAPLLPGPVDVYVDGRFVLASTLELTPRRGRAELGLGVEQAIKIARNVSFDDESSGLLKRHRELQHRVRIEIDNHLETPATVEVRERLPTVPDGQDDIAVSEGRIEPAWDEFDPKDQDLEGGRAWKVEVAAKGRRELNATWSIRIPQSHELVGGNRREG